MQEAKTLLARRSELLHGGGADAADGVRAIWQRLDELATVAAERFPLSDTDAVTLRADLRDRVLALYEGEVAAHAAMSATLAR